MKRQTLLWSLVGISLLDILVPVPILGIAAIWVVIRRPLGFFDRVKRLYAEDEGPS